MSDFLDAGRHFLSQDQRRFFSQSDFFNSHVFSSTTPWEHNGCRKTQGDEATETWHDRNQQDYSRLAGERERRSV
jgi:hypothetical protein